MNTSSTTTYSVIYGSHTLNTEWVLGTYSNIEPAMAHFSTLSNIRHSDEYVVLHVEHGA